MVGGCPTRLYCVPTGAVTVPVVLMGLVALVLLVLWQVEAADQAPQHGYVTRPARIRDEAGPDT